MVRRAYLVVGIATAAVVMTLVVASTSTGSILGGSGHPQAAPVSRASHIRAPDKLAPDSGAFPHWIVVGVTTLLILYAVGLVALLIASRRADSPPEEEELLDNDDEPAAGSAWGTVLSAELATAADEQLAALTIGTPRNAIVACWMRLQNATQRAGLPLETSETSQEYTVRALRSLLLDGAAITTLSELYREARFSEHEMLESHREQAGAALGVLAGQLTPRRSEPQPNGPRLDSVTR